jgi:hypothetical protein
MDLGRRQRLLAQRLVGGLEVPRQRLDLIPQRLRLHDQSLARHHPHLALQRQMVGVLRDCHAHGKGGRVPTARITTGGAGAVTEAPLHAQPVLLSSVLLDAIRRFHAGNALGRLALPDELGRCPATGRTVAVIGRQLVPDLDDRQGRLLARPVARSRGPRWGRRRRGGRGPVENRRARLLQRVLDVERELRNLGQPAQPRELGGQLEILGDEPLILALEQRLICRSVSTSRSSVSGTTMPRIDHHRRVRGK